MPDRTNVTSDMSGKMREGRAGRLRWFLRTIAAMFRWGRGARLVYRGKEQRLPEAYVLEVPLREVKRPVGDRAKASPQKQRANTGPSPTQAPAPEVAAPPRLPPEEFTSCDHCGVPNRASGAWCRFCGESLVQPAKARWEAADVEV